MSKEIIVDEHGHRAQLLDQIKFEKSRNKLFDEFVKK